MTSRLEWIRRHPGHDGRAWAPVRIFLALLLCAGSAGADVVGTGTYEIEITVPSFSGTGTLTWTSASYDVLGLSTVNLGSSIGEMDMSVILANSTPTSANFTMTLDATPGGTLTVDSNGSSICTNKSSPCNKPSFNSNVTSLLGSFVNAGAGTLPTGPDIVYVMDGLSTCAQTGLSTTSCSGTMALNAFRTQSTGAGSGVGVASTATYFDTIENATSTVDVALVFDEVTAGGDTTITASSREAGDLPPGLEIAVGSFGSDFVEISTTATFTGDVVTCTTYPDGDQDGVIDGTDTRGGVDECSVRLLHGDGSAYVDVTSSSGSPDCPIGAANRCPTHCIDTLANEVCGSVPSLSPFAVVLDTTFPVPSAGGSALVLLGGAVLALSRSRLIRPRPQR